MSAVQVKRVKSTAGCRDVAKSENSGVSGYVILPTQTLILSNLFYKKKGEENVYLAGEMIYFTNARFLSTENNTGGKINKIFRDGDSVKAQVEEIVLQKLLKFFSNFRVSSINSLNNFFVRYSYRIVLLKNIIYISKIKNISFCNIK